MGSEEKKREREVEIEEGGRGTYTFQNCPESLMSDLSGHVFKRSEFENEIRVRRRVPSISGSSKSSDRIGDVGEAVLVYHWDTSINILPS